MKTFFPREVFQVFISFIPTIDNLLSQMHAGKEIHRENGLQPLMIAIRFPFQ
jgi:hypothetical protein